MGFAKRFAKKSRFEGKPPPRASPVPRGLSARTIVFAIAAITAAATALVWHYSHEAPPLVRPAPKAPASAPTYNADAGEMPVPDFLLEGDAR